MHMTTIVLPASIALASQSVLDTYMYPPNWACGKQALNKDKQQNFWCACSTAGEEAARKAAVAIQSYTAGASATKLGGAEIRFWSPENRPFVS